MTYFILWALSKLHVGPTWWWRPGWCPHPSAVHPVPAPSSLCCHSARVWWTGCYQRCHWTPLSLCSKQNTNRNILVFGPTWGFDGFSGHSPKLFVQNGLSVFICRVQHDVRSLVDCESKEIDTESLKLKNICELWCWWGFQIHNPPLDGAVQVDTLRDAHQWFWTSWLFCCFRCLLWFWLGLPRHGNRARNQDRTVGVS